MELTGRLTLATYNLVHLGHAFSETTEEIFVHHYHPFVTFLSHFF